MFYLPIFFIELFFLLLLASFAAMTSLWLYNFDVKPLAQKLPQEVFHKKAALKNVAIFRGKHLRWSLFLKLQKFRNIHMKTPVLESLFNKVATLLKRDSNTVVFL